MRTAAHSPRASRGRLNGLDLTETWWCRHPRLPCTPSTTSTTSTTSTNDAAVWAIGAATTFVRSPGPLKNPTAKALAEGLVDLAEAIRR